MMYNDAIVSFFKTSSEIIIYGAGIIGKKLEEKFRQNDIHLSYFAVTSQVENDRYYRDIKILPIESLLSMKENATIIIAVAEKNQYEIYSNLKRYGFVNIYRVDEVMRKWIDDSL